MSRQQARSHGYLFAVADGVGGMDLGEVASATAISVLTEEFEKAQAGTMLIGLLPAPDSACQLRGPRLHGWRPNIAARNMATRWWPARLRHDQAVVSHVGDSRCYLVRNGSARQVTRITPG